MPPTSSPFVGSRREVHHGGGAAPDRAQGMLQRAGVGHALHLLVHAGLHIGGRVDMGFNTAGGHDPAGGVYGLHRLVGQGSRRADGDDAPILHARRQRRLPRWASPRFHQ